jgi:drug/metabolite transporter (DMT)-like permease
MQKNHNLLYILIFFAMFGWGLSWVSVKVLSRYINEYEMILFRFSITALSMMPVILVLKKSLKIDLKSFGLVAVTSVVMLAYMKYFFLGTKLGTASLGGAFVTTLIPIMTFILMVFLGKKEIHRKDVFALLLGAVGVLTILDVWHHDWMEIVTPYNLYFALAAFLWSVMTVLSAKSTQISPIVFTFYMYILTVVIDGLFFVDFSAIEYASFDALFWFNILALALLSTTFSNTVYFIGIEKLGASEVSSFAFLVPFYAIGFSAIFLGEAVNVWMIVGTVLTLIAVKILNNIRLRKSDEIKIPK